MCKIRTSLNEEVYCEGFNPLSNVATLVIVFGSINVLSGVISYVVEHTLVEHLCILVGRKSYTDVVCRYRVQYPS